MADEMNNMAAVENESVEEEFNMVEVTNLDDNTENGGTAGKIVGGLVVSGLTVGGIVLATRCEKFKKWRRDRKVAKLKKQAEKLGYSFVEKVDGDEFYELVDDDPVEDFTEDPPEEEVKKTPVKKPAKKKK